jgi:AcrR family transcriptional regulator
MPRRTPADRVTDIAQAACRVFIEKGYRRALMTDVGAQLGLSHALLYRYVEGKEALFELALMYAMDPSRVQAIEAPLPTPPPGRTLDLVRRWFTDQGSFPALGAALTSDHPQDAAEELLGIVDELYAFIERNVRLLALIQRSALDIPELHNLFYIRIRRAYARQLAGYLERRISSGDLRPVSDTEAAARFIIESVTWFAWHRKGDSDSGRITDEGARRTVRELLLAAFVPLLKEAARPVIELAE